ncbi:hypothetical protein [Polaromonas hydrogenivorans]|uniref:Uncharacterized protein n=1 Tax=Polaromonas hydrogenivorans TaxID=335476 RepID=A0AAU7LU66_9BURK
MIKLNSRGLAGAALSAALLAGCGDGGSHHGGVTPPPGPVAQTITDVVAYLNQLIAGTADSAEPIDINALTLATGDTSEPGPLQ